MPSRKKPEKFRSSTGLPETSPGRMTPREMLWITSIPPEGTGIHHVSGIKQNGKLIIYEPRLINRNGDNLGKPVSGNFCQAQRGANYYFGRAA